MTFEQRRPTAWSTNHVRFAINAGRVALWSWNVETDAITMDEAGFTLWGLVCDGPVTFEDLSAQIHPHDLDRVRADFAATRAVPGAYEIDFRIQVGNEIRWVSARGQGDDDGIAGPIHYGIFLNVTDRRQSEEDQKLLAEEMSHRVRNLLLIAVGLTEMTSRSATTTQDMARDLTNRLTALSHAHNLVRAVPDERRKGTALLGELIAVLLEPYVDNGAFSRRVHVSVPELQVGEAATTTLALAVHELATNSLKYGALSSARGTIDVSGTVEDGEVTMLWIEQGGPTVTPPSSAGFGTRMVDRGMSGRLGGSIAFQWRKEGAIVTLRMNQDRLAA